MFSIHKGNKETMFEFLMRLFKRRELTETPWRHPSNWNRKLQTTLVTEIKQLKPTRKLNLLVFGPIGAGKSSFVNSIVSVSKGRKFAMADTGYTGKSSVTLELHNHGHGELLSEFNLYDCMGIEPDGGIGMLEQDAMLLLDGHIKNRYEFSKDSCITEESNYFNRNPNAYDQMHCIIFVMSAQNILAGMPKAYVEKIQSLQKSIQRRHIPRILILTKVEHICDEVERDISLMFRSKNVHKAVKTASEMFALPQASIHPVKNYEEDFNVEPRTSIPILFALRQAMYYATDSVEYALHNEGHNGVENYNEDI